MDSNLLALLGIMVLAGLLGGWINFLIEQRDDRSGASLIRSVVIGVGASFLVPLFLNTISSTLIKAPEHSNWIEVDKYLVFSGFCLIASISSSAFIRTLSDRILNEVREAKKKVQAITEEIIPLAEKSQITSIRALMLQHLYRLPDGFKQTIRLADQYIAERGEPKDADFWISLAAAYGQSYKFAAGSNDEPTKKAAREKALDAVRKALAADEDKAKPKLQFIWNPAYPGKTAKDGEDDLEAFSKDEEFVKILGPA